MKLDTIKHNLARDVEAGQVSKGLSLTLLIAFEQIQTEIDDLKARLDKADIGEVETEKWSTCIANVKIKVDPAVRNLNMVSDDDCSYYFDQEETKELVKFPTDAIEQSEGVKNE